MPLLETLNSPPSKRIVRQVIELVSESARELGVKEVPECNVTAVYYRELLKREVKIYLERVGLTPAAPTSLTLAYNDKNPKTVDGFILHLPEVADAGARTDATTVSYMAVRKSARGNGLGRQMLEHVRSKWPVVYLDCKVDRLAYFEAMGFQILEPFRNHFILCTVTGRQAGLIAKVNIDALMMAPEQKQVLKDLSSIHGAEKVLRDLDLVKERTEAAEAQIERLWADRLAGRP